MSKRLQIAEYFHVNDFYQVLQSDSKIIKQTIFNIKNDNKYKNFSINEIYNKMIDFNHENHEFDNFLNYLPDGYMYYTYTYDDGYREKLHVIIIVEISYRNIKNKRLDAIDFVCDMSHTIMDYEDEVDIIKEIMDNIRKDIPNAKYINCDKELTDEEEEICGEVIETLFPCTDVDSEFDEFFKYLPDGYKYSVKLDPWDHFWTVLIIKPMKEE